MCPNRAGKVLIPPYLARFAYSGLYFRGAVLCICPIKIKLSSLPSHNGLSLMSQQGRCNVQYAATGSNTMPIATELAINTAADATTLAQTIFGTGPLSPAQHSQGRLGLQVPIQGPMQRLRGSHRAMKGSSCTRGRRQISPIPVARRIPILAMPAPTPSTVPQAIRSLIQCRARRHSTRWCLRRISRPRAILSPCSSPSLPRSIWNM